MDASPRPAEGAEETFLALRRVMAAIRGRFHGALREHDLTFPQWLVLKSLKRRGRVNLREVAGTLECTPANATGIVDRLEAAHLVSRAQNPDDRREVFVRLTEEGHEKVDAVVGAANRVLADMFDGWTQEELAQMRGLVERIRLRPEDQQDF